MSVHLVLLFLKFVANSYRNMAILFSQSFRISDDVKRVEYNL
jgi:hypothetical protein